MGASIQPRVLGDFIVGEQLGEGGFGTVYRAEQRALGRPAVVKVIRRSLVERRDSAERFMLEARLASRFDHPYAAHVYAFGTEPDGSMWIAMELVNGTPLDELIARAGPIPIERFVPFMERLCDVIQSAHDQKIVHRDIKPSNVMVIARAGRLMPKLLDFGIAKALDGVPGVMTRPTARESRPAGHVGLDNTLDAAGSEVSTDDTHAPDASADDTIAATAPATESASLTRAGQILGSPPYMAPEQWIDAGQVGPWTDQYALALLAYEAITGKRAFSGSSITAMMDEHERSPLPALPAHLPVALHGVLARAAAKQPADRFATLTELAAEFRKAALHSATEIDDGQPITLPAELRSQWMEDAPQPLAEAVAILVATRAPAKIAERACAVGGLLARWLGVLGLACQSRIGRVPANEGSAAHELALATRRRALSAREWLDLAAALAKPFADRPEAWPIPELATFVNGSALDDLRELVHDEQVFEVADATIQHVAQQRIDELARVLASLAWLLDYGLARGSGDHLELWMGLPPRGANEERATVAGSSTTRTGELVVLDADGAPTVRLWPLVQVARPAPGEPEEMFMFAGPSRAGDSSSARSYPRGFERDDAQVWPWFAAHLLEASAEATALADDERCPYPGLAAFTANDHAVFVGREREVEELINRLRTHAIASVVGPSGVGKSSFIAAGVIPALPASWHAETIRPGSDPLGALRSIVERAESSPYRDAVDRTPSTAALGAALVSIVRRRGGTLLIVVDQAEELFTLGATEDDRAAFAEALVFATASNAVRVVLSLRDDFLCRTDELAAWHGVLARGVQVLRVPQPADLERMIRIPARRCGYDFDDAGLPAAIVEDVAEQPGALPLVAFAAAELWQMRDRHFKRLTRTAYEQIGGVTGAIVQHADGVVDRMPSTDRRLVRLAFRRLLTAEGTRASLGRSELVVSIGDGAEAERVIDRLIAARLVVSRDDEAGERIEIIHETLVTTWPRLAAWRQEDAASTKIHERLAAAAVHWEEQRRAAALLWRGTALDDLRRLRREDVALTPVEGAFAMASERAALRVRNRRIATIASAFGILVAGTLGLAWANRRISGQRETAVARLAASFEERARLAVEKGDATHAALYLAESRRLGARSEGADLLVAHVEATLESRVRVIGHSDSPIVYSNLTDDLILATGSDGKLRAWRSDGRSTVLAENVSFAAMIGDAAMAVETGGTLAAYDLVGRPRWRVDGVIPTTRTDVNVIGSARSDLVLTYGPRARLWRLSDGAARGELATGGAVSAAVLDESGTIVATGDANGAVQVWDVSTGRELVRCPSHGGNVERIAVSPDGRLVITGGSDREIHVCDRATGTLAHRAMGHRSKINSLVVTADSTTLVSGSRDGSAMVWNLQTGVAQATFVHGAAVIAVVLSPDERELLTVGRDGNGRLWDRDSGAAIGSLQGHVGLISAARWEDNEIVTTSLDGSIRRWSVERARRIFVRPQHAQLLDLDVRGDLTLAAGRDGRVLAWNHRTRQLAGSLTIAAPAIVAQLSPDGQHIVTVDGAGAAAVWSARDFTQRTKLASGVKIASFLADGTLATGDAGNMLRLWTVEGSPIGEIDVGLTPMMLTPDPSGRWLAVAPNYDEVAKIVVVDVREREIATRLDSEPRNTVVFDQTRLAMTRGSAIDVIEVGTWRRLARLEGHKGKTVKAWFLRDGRILSSADDARLLLWSKNGVLERALDTGVDTIYEVAQSADGALLTAIGYEGALRIFDARSFERVLTLPGHRGFTAMLRFAGNDTVVSAGSDGRTILWDVRRSARTAAELAELVRCYVPLRIEGDAAMPRDLDLDDPTCHGATQAK